MDHAVDLVGLASWTARLRELSSIDWGRVAAAVADQRGHAIQATWRRAAHRRLWLAPVTSRYRRLLQLAFFAGELAREFLAPRSAAEDARRLRETGERTGNASLSAMADVWEITRRALPDDGVTREAVLIAGQAIGNRARMPPHLFEEAYAPFASVIPTTTLY